MYLPISATVEDFTHAEGGMVRLVEERRAVLAPQFRRMLEAMRTLLDEGDR